MFEEQFYPTKKETVLKMLEPYKKEVRRTRLGDEHIGIDFTEKWVLDPSAGKGDILDVIRELHKYNESNLKLFAIEIDPNLQSILRDKGYSLIGNDFLEFQSDRMFDIIIMNPPFATGDKHLLKAWEIMYEGDIICLLNSETINNPYTANRKLLANIIEQNGTVEDMGNCFSDAEVPTDVNVSMVRLHKKAAQSKFEFKFTSRGMENKPDLNEENIRKNEVETIDIIGNTVIQFGQLQDAFVKYMKAIQGLHYYSRGLLKAYTSLEEIIKNAGFNGINSYNTFSDTIRSNAWDLIIEKCGIEKYMTSGAHNSFQKFVREQGSMPFTKENIYAVIKLIIDNSGNLLEQAILEVFDIFTQYHDENRCHIEGWKTNDSWKVNRKVILPYGCSYGSYMTAQDVRKYGDRFSLNSSRDREYSDIDKALCYISGKKFDDKRFWSIRNTLDHIFRSLGKVCSSDKFDNTCSSTFFDIKFFKKGTIHITFKDESLWQEFNIRATKMKKWLPDIEYNEWKMKKNGNVVIPKERRLEAENKNYELEFTDIEF